MFDHRNRNEIDAHTLLASIDDLEERARTRREWGLHEEDEQGRRNFAPSLGAGPQASLNCAILGPTLEAYIHHTLDDAAMAAEALRERDLDKAERVRTAPYLSREEVKAVYDAAACLGQVYELTCNAFITIAYRALGLDDSEAETKLLTDFLDEAAGQMQRWRYPFHAIYVHEHSLERGRHTHVLATVDVRVKASFIRWARDGAKSFFWRHCGIATKDAVDIVVKGTRTPATKALWQYDRVMYMTKGLDPTVMDRDMETGELTPLYLLLGLKEKWQDRPAGVIPYRHRIGTTQAIGYRARRRLTKDGMPLLSPFADRAWRWLRLDHTGFGWELSEYVVRHGEVGYRARAISVNDYDEDAQSALRDAQDEVAELSHEDWYAVLRHVREERRAELMKRHPYEWERPWAGWWHADGRGLQKWGGKSAKEGLARLGYDWTASPLSMLETFED